MGNSGAPRGPRPGLKHRVEHLFFRGLLGAIANRPLAAAVRRGQRLGRMWHALDRRHRRLAEESIRLGLGVDRAAAARTARACFEHLGRTLAEFAADAAGTAEMLDRFVLEGTAHLREALAGGRGAFVLSAHCGNWELLGARVSRVVTLTSVARAMSNPLVDGVIASRRDAAGVRTLDARDATREILRRLRANEAVGILLDQSAVRSESVFVPFLGRPASTNFGLAMLAVRTGAPVLPAFAVRGPDGVHRGRVGPPIPAPAGGTRAERVGVATARYTAAIESFVREHPEQWFWVHNRWKRKPDPGETVWQP